MNLSKQACISCVSNNVKGLSFNISQHFVLCWLSSAGADLCAHEDCRVEEDDHRCYWEIQNLRRWWVVDPVSPLWSSSCLFFFYFIYLIFLNSDARKQWMQKTDLLRKLIIQLKDDENNRELSKWTFSVEHVLCVVIVPLTRHPLDSFDSLANYESAGRGATFWAADEKRQKHHWFPNSR